jgi:hypothetical protein
MKLRSRIHDDSFAITLSLQLAKGVGESIAVRVLLPRLIGQITKAAKTA